MKISIFSEKEHQLTNRGWFKGGEGIQYKCNKDSNSESGGDNPKKPYYMLSFTYAFAYDDDTILMGFAEPYTYTNLQNDLSIFRKKCL